MKSLEVLFTSAEFGALGPRDLDGTLCVVFDVLRATTTMITALHHGAAAVIPVADIPEALALRAQRPEVLLAGERDGLRITGALTGGVEFDLGNSPREFTPERISGRTIVMTTTNGTRALRSCAHARRVLVAGLVNLAVVAREVLATSEVEVLIVCSGTHEEASFEDTLGAGALCEALWPHAAGARIADSAEIARQIYRQHAEDLVGAMRHARNGRRLLALPALARDVAVCLERDTIPCLVELGADGAVRRMG
jgi:2-phosphosulfolactate phosphatase